MSLRIGIDESTTLGLQSGNSVIALIGEALCVLFIDRLGRRWPLISANAASGLTFVVGTCIIAIYPASANNGNAARAFVRHAYRSLGCTFAHLNSQVSMTWLFNLVFSAAIGPLSWAIPVGMWSIFQTPVVTHVTFTEMFNSATRAKATSITSSAAWISNCVFSSLN